MSLGVLNNIAAIYAQNNLNQTQNSLQNTLTQLSSGSRINSGADDAAGLAVANGLAGNVAALNAVLAKRAERHRPSADRRRRSLAGHQPA